MTEREAIVKLAHALRQAKDFPGAASIRTQAQQVLDALRAAEPRESTPPPTSGRDGSRYDCAQLGGPSAPVSAGTKPAGGVDVCVYCLGTGTTRSATPPRLERACEHCHGTGKKSAPGQASGPRFVELSVTSPSGKTLYACVSCGHVDPAPSKRHTCDAAPSLAFGVTAAQNWDWQHVEAIERDLAALRAWADEAPVNAAYTEGFITHYDHWIGRRPDKDRMGRADGRPEEVGRG